MAPHCSKYSCLENPMDGGAWWAAVHGVARSRTRLSNFTFTLHFHAREKEMATHSSVLAWRIPGKGEPGGLQSLGLHRVGHDWSDLAAAAAARIIWNEIHILFQIYFTCGLYLFLENYWEIIFTFQTTHDVQLNTVPYPSDLESEEFL